MPASLTLPGLRIVEHEIVVPLDHARPDGDQITVFAREVADADGPDRPYLLFFQGGPGSEATRPTAAPPSPAWLARALREFRVLLLDQRGTGRSTPVGALPRRDPAAQAQYLSHFRADAIVRDAEHLRRALGVERWSVLGQSFGGLCVMTYLSVAPEGLDLALIAGGLAPLDAPADDVYRATYARMLARNERYYARYPGDVDRVLTLQDHLEREDVRLPSGDRLTARRLRLAGGDLGMSYGFERLHHLLELPVDSPAFLHDVEAAIPYARNPLYAVLHEACWADGTATRWSAARMLPDAFVQRPELFFGEHLFPWIFEEISALRPLREAADLLAHHEWPALYDAEVLAANTVPVAAVIYSEDVYVEREFSEDTAARIRGLRSWLTSEYDHNGLRADGDRILDRLLDLARGRV